MNSVQCKMARVALGLGVRDLAKLANVAQATVSRLERGEELKPTTVAIIQAALEEAGVEFIPENGGGPGVRLAKEPNPFAGLPFPVFEFPLQNGLARFGVFKPESNFDRWTFLTIIQMNKVSYIDDSFEAIQSYWEGVFKEPDVVDQLLKRALDAAQGPRKPDDASKLRWAFLQPEHVFPDARRFRALINMNWESSPPEFEGLFSELHMGFPRGTGFLWELPFNVKWWKYD